MERIVNWFVNIYIDANFTGSIFQKGGEWIEENKGQIDKDNSNENKVVYDLVLLESIASLQITAYTSCGALELSNFSNNGKGSLWTSYFVTKGVRPTKDDWGNALFA